MAFDKVKETIRDHKSWFKNEFGKRRIINSFDDFTEMIFMVLVIGVLISFGWLENYISFYVGGISLLILVLWYMRVFLSGSLAWVKTGLLLPYAAFALLALIQIIPLPASLISVISPSSASFYKEINGGTLPGFITISVNTYLSYNNFLSIFFFSILYFSIVNIVFGKGFVKRIISIFIIISVLFSILWMIRVYFSDFGTFMGSIMNVSDDTTSLFFSRDIFFWYLIVPFFLVLGISLTEFENEWQTLYYIAAVIIGVTLLFSGDVVLIRSVVVGLGFFGLIAVFSKGGKRVHNIFLAALIILAAALTYLITPRICSFFFFGAEKKLTQLCSWSEVVFMLKGSGIAGLGFGLGKTLSSPDSAVLSFVQRILLESGFVGIISISTLIVVYFYKSVKMLFFRGDMYVKLVAAAGLASFVALLYASAYSNPFISVKIVMTVVITAALVYIILRLRFGNLSRTEDAKALFTHNVIRLKKPVKATVLLSLVLVTVFIIIPFSKKGAALYYYLKFNQTASTSADVEVVLPYGNLFGDSSDVSGTSNREKYINKALELDPNNIQFLCELAKLSEAKGDSKKALELFEKALSLNPMNRDIRSRITAIAGTPEE